MKGTSTSQIMFLRRKPTIMKLAALLVVTILIGLHLVSSPIEWQKFKRNDKLTVKKRIISWKRTSSLREKANRIYFHETSGTNSLNLRQLCAVESTAKENPNRPIELFLLSDNVNLTGALGSVMKRYPNIAIVLMNATEYYMKTPLEDWYLRGEWKTSPHKIVHLADYTRILSLYQEGGMYMDLDFVTLKALDPKVFRNFAAGQGNASLTNSVFHFERNHPIVGKMLTYLATSYRPQEWAHAGPKMFKAIILKHCQKELPQPTYPEFLCSAVSILPASFLNPFPWTDWKKVFQKGVNRTDRVLQGYTIHVYNKMTKDVPVVIGSNQLYELVARQHCPETFSHAISYF